MKFFVMLSLLASMAFSASAKEVFVQEFDLGMSPGHYAGMVQSNAKFYVDTVADQGMMSVTAVEHYNYPRFPVPCTPYHCDPVPAPYPHQWQLLNTKVAIPGLVVEGKELVYRGEEGDVVCATLSTTRWLGNLQINLTGKCQLQSRYSYATRTLRVSFNVQ